MYRPKQSTPESKPSRFPHGDFNNGAIPTIALSHDNQPLCILPTWPARRTLANIVWVEDPVTMHFPKHLLMSPYTLGFPRNLALRRLNKSFSKPLNISHSLLYPFEIP